MTGLAEYGELACGDVVFVDRDATRDDDDGFLTWVMRQAIRFGQRLRHYPPDARRFTHTALVLDQDGMLAEALGSGVRRTHITRYNPEDVTIARARVDSHDQAQVLAFAENVLAARTRYGRGTFAALAVYCLTGTRYAVAQAGTAICSGLVADALTRAGYIWERPPFACLPADLAVELGVA